MIIITITSLEKGDDVERLLVLPRSLEELKQIGVNLYGAPFVRVLNEDGIEINDIHDVRNGDRLVYASRKRDEELNARVTVTVTVTITCLEKGDAIGKLLVLPSSFEELKQIGVKIYGAPFIRVLNEEGDEITDIRVVRNGDRIVFACQSIAQNRAEESNAQKRVEKSNARSNAQKRAKESNARKRTEESNARKRDEESNALVTITCLTPFMRMLSEVWCPIHERVKRIWKELRSMNYS